MEVRKLYPDAELPSFETLQTAETEMSMTYKSARPLQSFCHGLIEDCLTHYGTPGGISVVDRYDGHPAHVVILLVNVLIGVWIFFNGGTMQASLLWKS